MPTKRCNFSLDEDFVVPSHMVQVLYLFHYFPQQFIEESSSAELEIEEEIEDNWNLDIKHFYYIIDCTIFLHPILLILSNVWSMLKITSCSCIQTSSEIKAENYILWLKRSLIIIKDTSKHNKSKFIFMDDQANGRW